MQPENHIFLKNYFLQNLRMALYSQRWDKNFWMEECAKIFLNEVGGLGRKFSMSVLPVTATDLST